MEPPWVELERSVVAASLGEASPQEAVARMCDAMNATGVSCALLDAGMATIVPGSAAERSVQVAVRRPDEGLATLVLDASHALPPPSLARLVRLFECVLQTGSAVSTSAASLHRLRNRLAGVLGNIEFVEMAVAEMKAFDQRQEILAALRHARRSCRDVASALHPTERKNSEGSDEP